MMIWAFALIGLLIIFWFVFVAIGMIAAYKHDPANFDFMKIIDNVKPEKFFVYHLFGLFFMAWYIWRFGYFMDIKPPTSFIEIYTNPPSESIYIFSVPLVIALIFLTMIETPPSTAAIYASGASMLSHVMFGYINRVYYIPTTEWDALHNIVLVDFVLHILFYFWLHPLMGVTFDFPFLRKLDRLGIRDELERIKRKRKTPEG